MDLCFGIIWQPDLDKGNIKCQLENQTQGKPSKPGQESSEIAVQLATICHNTWKTSDIFVSKTTQTPAPGFGINLDFSTKLTMRDSVWSEEVLLQGNSFQHTRFLSLDKINKTFPFFFAFTHRKEKLQSEETSIINSESLIKCWMYACFRDKHGLYVSEWYWKSALALPSPEEGYSQHSSVKMSIERQIRPGDLSNMNMLPVNKSKKWTRVMLKDCLNEN